jgi:alkaline phosphatase
MEVFLVVFLLLSICTCKSINNSAKDPINVIFMLADGFGPSSETFARSVFQSEYGRRTGFQLPLDTILKGTIRTCSADSLITDSGAGATAYSCGQKTYNGAIAMSVDGKPLGTLMEAAKQAGMATGLVVTNKITDATPASFVAHNESRENENEIAAMQIGLTHPLKEPQADLMIGGGLCHFLPGTHSKSCRTDGKDLVKEATVKFNFKPILNKSEFDKWDPIKSAQSGQRVLGLLAKKQLSFDIDRLPNKEPSIDEMTLKALKYLKTRSFTTNNKGFFLVVEGSRIDVAAHSNDSPAHYHEIIAYQKAVKVAIEFVKKNPNTLLISVSDHETGGLTLGLQHPHEDYPDYLWNPSSIWKVSHSSLNLSQKMCRVKTEELEKYLRTKLFPEELGIPKPEQDEINALLEAEIPLARELILNKIINRRARIGWTTHGHSGVDINLYATGYGSELFGGNLENTEVSDKIAQVLGLDLKKITEKLQ